MEENDVLEIFADEDDSTASCRMPEKDAPIKDNTSPFPDNTMLVSPYTKQLGPNEEKQQETKFEKFIRDLRNFSSEDVVSKIIILEYYDGGIYKWKCKDYYRITSMVIGYTFILK